MAVLRLEAQRAATSPASLARVERLYRAICKHV